LERFRTAPGNIAAPTNSTIQFRRRTERSSKRKDSRKNAGGPLTREHRVTERVKKVKTKSKGPSICIMSQELNTIVDLILMESVGMTIGSIDAEFWARHTETDQIFFFK
jgi:hypothetical protein